MSEILSKGVASGSHVPFLSSELKPVYTLPSFPSQTVGDVIQKGWSK